MILSMTFKVIPSPILLSVPTFEFWKTVHMIMNNLYIFPVLHPLNSEIIPHKNNTNEHYLFYSQQKTK
jgi:hypothetical protein